MSEVIQSGNTIRIDFAKDERSAKTVSVIQPVATSLGPYLPIQSGMYSLSTLSATNPVKAKATSGS